MATAYTVWREKLIDSLTTILPSTYQVIPGNPGSVIPAENFGVAYGWIEKVTLDEQNKLIETVTAGIKVFPIPTEGFDPTVATDPTAVEDLAYQLQVGLSPTQEPGDPWFFEIVQMQLDYAPESVTAEIRGTRWNTFAINFDSQQ